MARARASTHPLRPTSPAGEKLLARVRKICLALPDATERVSHGGPWFFVGESPSFAAFMDNHHQDGRIAIWCAAPPGAQDVLVGADPELFFVPPYVGHRGWIGVRVDRAPDWNHIAALLADAHASVAKPKRKAPAAAPASARPRTARRPRGTTTAD